MLINHVPLALLAGGAVASPLTLAPRTCYPNENDKQLCYRPPNGDPQGVDIKDVQFIATYLRNYGAQTRAGRLFNMAAKDTSGCGEWQVYAHGTAQAVAKHIDPSVDTSVLFADIATTIDGGANATPAQQAAALIGCGTDGGSLGVAVNASNPAYSGSTYPKGYVTKGIVVKIDVDEYKLHVSGKVKPWWPTNITDLNGYYFDEDGGHFCSATNLGVTASIRRIERRPNGSTLAPKDERIASIIICPSAFSNPRAPNNYRDASNNIVLPGKSLGDCLPKSATLLHETFHAIFGEVMLAGPAEKYDIADVINLSALKSQKNIENYVFFIAHMYLLFGQANAKNPQDPVSVPKNWDFKVTGTRGKKTYGAVNIIP
ncbi:hypothetical protein A9K55_001053 [Cordyceps militaris]|uniref:Lysine-specific metallo-endopeptidase domain-containing protein n=1 Tax=Cordyceps militaris TaxID=73501 RepID=A0A2H4STZ0_CORMI|nr:hypothetical protein A9K55_001053 [Cordyceps militaris]